MIAKRTQPGNDSKNNRQRRLNYLPTELAPMDVVTNMVGRRTARRTGFVQTHRFPSYTSTDSVQRADRIAHNP
jgi:hypothetical protein